MSNKDLDDINSKTVVTIEVEFNNKLVKVAKAAKECERLIGRLAELSRKDITPEIIKAERVEVEDDE